MRASNLAHMVAGGRVQFGTIHPDEFVSKLHRLADRIERPQRFTRSPPHHHHSWGGMARTVGIIDRYHS